MARVPDDRALHFWDDGQVMRLFSPVLGLRSGAPAWDVLLLDAPGVQWVGTAPPRPQFWMHNLHESNFDGPPPVPRRDGARLAKELVQMLE